MNVEKGMIRSREIGGVSLDSPSLFRSYVDLVATAPPATTRSES
jgi:hypothetical protein